MSWERIAEEKDILEFLDVCEATDAVVYPYSLIKGEREFMVKRLLSNVETKQSQLWLYRDGDARAAMELQPYTENEVPALKFAHYCAVGFDADVYANWKIAYPILVTKCREILDAEGIDLATGRIPRTRNGECLAYMADAYAWEAVSVAIDDSGTAYRIRFERNPDRKPAKEELFEQVKESEIVPDAKPK